MNKPQLEDPGDTTADHQSEADSGLLRPAFSTVPLSGPAPQGYIFSFQPIRTSQALSGHAVKKPRTMDSCIIIQ
ncbi:hypothetical protein GCM10010391_72230 [Streptomyces anthocyanicus]|nr:hypothetical protein GCM10010391_72230 [Streptomyces anthocyanicus]